MVVSAGNFHGQPLALALDCMAIALSEYASISERRTYKLISGERGLEVYLAKEPGVNSGFMIPQYTAASIVSQNKQLATPASVDSIVSSNGQEDHVSMGANAATKAFQVVVPSEGPRYVRGMCKLITYLDQQRWSVLWKHDPNRQTKTCELIKNLQT